MPKLGILRNSLSTQAVLYPMPCHRGNSQGVLNRTNLKQLRVERAMSQTVLAETIGTTLNMYGKLERGERRLNMDWLQKLAVALGVGMDEIVADVEDAPEQMAGELPTPSLEALQAALSEHYTSVMGAAMPSEMMADLAERLLDTVENWKDDPAAARDPQVARSVARQINRRFAS